MTDSDLQAFGFTVRLQDTDAAGVIFFPHLLHHAHDAYDEFLRHSGIELARLLTEGPHLPIVHCAADYLAPMRLGDRVLVRMSRIALGERSFTLGYRFADAAGKPVARVRTVHVAIDAATGKARPLPQHLRRALTRLPEAEDEAG